MQATINEIKTTWPDVVEVLRTIESASQLPGHLGTEAFELVTLRPLKAQRDCLPLQNNSGLLNAKIACFSGAKKGHLFLKKILSGFIWHFANNSACEHRPVAS